MARVISMFFKPLYGGGIYRKNFLKAINNDYIQLQKTFGCLN